MRNLLLASCAALIAAGAGVAQASTIPFSGNVFAWNALTPGANIGSATQIGSPTNPIVTNSNGVLAATYSGPINFVDNTLNTVGGFLSTSPGFTYNVIATQGAGLGATLSQPNFAQVTVFDFTFTVPYTITATITHDDGISIWDAGNTTKLFDASSPTTASTMTGTIFAGTYNLWYAEANGLPADLIFDVPEPAGFAALGVGLLGLGLVRRRATMNG